MNKLQRIFKKIKKYILSRPGAIKIAGKNFIFNVKTVYLYTRDEIDKKTGYERKKK
jgi:hypothetical protein